MNHENYTETIQVYTITLTVECDADRLAEEINRQFGDYILGIQTKGPFEVPAKL